MEGVWQDCTRSEHEFSGYRGSFARRNDLGAGKWWFDRLVKVSRLKSTRGNSTMEGCFLNKKTSFSGSDELLEAIHQSQPLEHTETDAK